MTEPEVSVELRVLQSIRLAGVADSDAILARALVRDADLERALAVAGEERQVERFAFGDTAGWVITEAGAHRLAALLRDELVVHGAAGVLETALGAFEPLNQQFVTLVSEWQLESTSATTTGFGTADAAEGLLAELSQIGSRLREVLSDVVRVLPRFGRYAAQYDLALGRAREAGLRWVTGVGLLSCHVVWAELHQDLLSSLGRRRTAESPR